MGIVIITVKQYYYEAVSLRKFQPDIHVNRFFIVFSIKTVGFLGEAQWQNRVYRSWCTAYSYIWHLLL